MWQQASLYGNHEYDFEINQRAIKWLWLLKELEVKWVQQFWDVKRMNTNRISERKKIPNYDPDQYITCTECRGKGNQTHTCICTSQPTVSDFLLLETSRNWVCLVSWYCTIVFQKCSLYKIVVMRHGEAVWLSLHLQKSAAFSCGETACALKSK